MKTQPLKLVQVNQNIPFTTTLAVANGCDLEHASVIKLVRKYLEDFQEFGPCRFQIAQGEKLAQGGFARSTEYAELNEDQATYLITLFRNTPIVRQFKITLVKEFRRALKTIETLLNDPARKAAIQYKRDTAKTMTDMLMFVRETQSKATSPKHYSNEHLFCNRALTGSYKALDESDLDEYDAKLLAAIRIHNSMLMTRNLPQPERKESMDKFVTEYRQKNPRLSLVG